MTCRRKHISYLISLSPSDPFHLPVCGLVPKKHQDLGLKQHTRASDTRDLGKIFCCTRPTMQPRRYETMESRNGDTGTYIIEEIFLLVK